MNLVQLWLSAQDLHKIGRIHISSWWGKSPTSPQGTTGIGGLLGEGMNFFFCGVATEKLYLLNYKTPMNA